MADRNASLAEQMQHLKNSMQRREKRRDQERRDRMARSEFEGGLADVYGEGPGGARKRPRNATGGVQWGSAAAAVAAAAQLGGAQQLRCDLCQATFGNDAQMQQHLEGPAHRKALERQRAEHQRRERLGRSCDAAEAAVAAAAWNARQGQARPIAAGMAEGAAALPHQAPALVAHAAHLQPRGPAVHPSRQQLFQQPPPQQTQQQRQSGSHQHQHQQQAGQPGRGGSAGRGSGGSTGGPSGGGRAAQSDLLSHEELLRQARGEGEVLSIGGWVPPTVLPPAPSGESAQALPAQAVAQAGGPSGSVAGAADAGVGSAAADGHLQTHTQQEQQEEDEGGRGGLMEGLVAYGGGSDDEESSGGSSSGGSEQLRQRVVSAGVEVVGPVPCVEAVDAAAVVGEPEGEGPQLQLNPGQSESGEEGSGSSDSDVESGGGQPVAFFTF